MAKAQHQTYWREGSEAGGQVRGTTLLKRLLSEVIASSDVPVLASGGIPMPLSSGTEGVVIGTAFLASPDSFEHDCHKGAARNRQVPR